MCLRIPSVRALSTPKAHRNSSKSIGCMSRMVRYPIGDSCSSDSSTPRSEPDAA